MIPAPTTASPTAPSAPVLPPTAPEPVAAGQRGRTAIAVGVMLLAVIAVYVPPRVATGQLALFGMDYDQLHLRRMDFARKALLGPEHSLPGWYPPDLMGTPFRANLQAFPWIPLRLVLLAFDPWRAFAVGIALCGCFGSLFTFLLARSLRLGRIASAVAGWTFVCNGFFAARVLVGHLPILETVWLLPALLWLCLGALRAAKPWPWLAGLSFTAFCCAVAGHPQLGFYSLATTAAFLLASRSRRAFSAAAAIAGGLLCSAFAVLPMAALILRSFRVLKLDAADNDVPMVYGRLLAFFAPWKDGWPFQVQRFPNEPFQGYPTVAYFWDTVVYSGLLPWLAVLVLAVLWLRRPRQPLPRGALFIAVASVVALVTALPDVAKLWSLIPGTSLRSASRQVYVTELGLALAMGAGLHLLLNARGLFEAGFRRALVAVLVLAHGYDVASHARAFLVLRPPEGTELPEVARLVSKVPPDQRVAMDFEIGTFSNRQKDDVGFFDSLALVDSYRWLLAISDLPPGLNVEALNGSELPRRALESSSVSLVVAKDRRPDDLPLIGMERGFYVYRVPSPVPRAMFFPASRVRKVSQAELIERLRSPLVDLRDGTMLVDALAKPDGSPPGAAAGGPIVVPFSRRGSDEIELTVQAPSPGVLRVLESIDTGWRAEVDGQRAPLLMADGFAMAVALPAGEHRVRLTYSTPYLRAGELLSALGLLLLVAGLWWSARRTAADATSVPVEA